MSAPSYFDERWFGLLADAVASHPRGRQGVSERLGPGFSRTMISLVLSGRYENTTAIARRVIAVFDRNVCPYLGIAIANEQCVEVNSGPVPTWDPAALDQRRCCQTCPHKPNLQGDAK